MTTALSDAAHLADQNMDLFRRALVQKANRRSTSMKRISIAEQTLKKQIDRIRFQHEQVYVQINLLKEQANVYFQMISDLETEQNRLYKQRTTMKERLAP